MLTARGRTRAASSHAGLSARMDISRFVESFANSMNDEYPTEDQLDAIELWTRENGWKELLAFVKSLWWASDWGWSQDGNTYRVSTGGWSGNESLIDALRNKHDFWEECCDSMRRGGHYIFEVLA